MLYEKNGMIYEKVTLGNAVVDRVYSDLLSFNADVSRETMIATCMVIDNLTGNVKRDYEGDVGLYVDGILKDSTNLVDGVGAFDLADSEPGKYYLHFDLNGFSRCEVIFNV